MGHTRPMQTKRLGYGGTLIDTQTGTEDSSDSGFRCSAADADLTYTFAP